LYLIGHFAGIEWALIRIIDDINNKLPNQKSKLPLKYKGKIKND